jgi:hypothetical protein
VTTTVVTPTLRRATGRSLFWIIAAGFVVVVAVIATLLGASARAAGTPFSATDASPKGSKAIAQVLAQQGVDVIVADTLTGARAGLRDHSGSTLLVADPNDYLSATQLRSLAGLATHVVLPSPTFDQLGALAPGVRSAGAVKRSELRASCDLTAATRAGTVTGTGIGFRVPKPVGTVAAEATTCFGSGDGVYSLVDIDRAGRSITVIGTSAAFSNERVAERGNAALALNLLGQSEHLVWYLPTIGDARLDTKPTVAQLTPPWVSPVIVLLIISVIVAGVWRGRRLGPLVIENLPVTVRASETMEGRARLYQKGAARLHALDALRIGTVSRLATLCGLPRLASVDDVISAVASITGRDLAGVRSLMLDATPSTDRDLVRLSDALLELERATATAIRPHS